MVHYASRISKPLADFNKTPGCGDKFKHANFDKFKQSRYWGESCWGRRSRNHFPALEPYTNIGIHALANSTNTTSPYSTSLLFNNTGQTKGVGEPNHCGEPGGAPAWISYPALASGILHATTDGSEIDTVLAALPPPWCPSRVMITAAQMA